MRAEDYLGPSLTGIGIVGGVPLVDATTAGSSLDQALPPQVGEMGKGLSHRQVTLRLQEGLGDMDLRNLTDRAGPVADHGMDGFKPAMFVPCYRIDAASAIGE